MLKTGIESTAYFGVEDYEQGLKKMKLHGYDCADYQEVASPSSILFGYSDGAFERYFKELGACAKETGIEFYQMHGLWPRYTDKDWNLFDKDIELYQKEFLVAKYIGCKRLVIHPCMPYGWGVELDKGKAFEQTLEMVETLLPYAKQTDTLICVENMPFAKGHSFSEIAEIKRLIATVNDERVKACFDTGHNNCSQEDIYECIVTLGEDLEALHVHDDLRRQDRHLLPFQGEVDWDKFIKGLQKIGYTGCISLETQISKKMPEPIREKMQLALSEIARFFALQISMP